MITEARQTLDFAIYGFRTQPQVLDALIEARQRGVVVRGVVDKDVDGKSYYSGTEELIQRLGNIQTDYEVDRKTQAKRNDFDAVPFWPKPEGFKGPAQCIGYSLPGNRAIIAVHASLDEFPFKGDIMHDKFVIADHRIVWTGSCNVSDSDSGGYNANVGAVIDSPVVAGWFTREFNQMFERGLFHRTKKDLGRGSGLSTALANGSALDVFFSPQGNAMEDGVRPELQGAKRSIDVALFYLTHKLLTADLIKAHQRGVRVRVIVDASSATNGYTKHEILRAAGIPVKVEDWGGKMHMKAASIDGSILIFGSMNWTSAGEYANDENTLILHDPIEAQRSSAFFDTMWRSINDKWLTANPMPESTDSRNALNDGIDNDFDDLVDGADDPDPKPVPLPPYRIVPKADGYGLIKGAIVESGSWSRLPPFWGKDIADASDDPLGLKFDSLPQSERSALVESLCELNIKDLGQIKGEPPDFAVSWDDPRPPCWFVRRLNLIEYQSFIHSWVNRVPLEPWEAWLLVWISWTNIQGFRDESGWRPHNSQRYRSIRVTHYQHACPFFRDLLKGNPIQILQSYPRQFDRHGVRRSRLHFRRLEEIYAYYDYFVPECSASDLATKLNFIHWHPLLAHGLIDALVRENPTLGTKKLVFSLFFPVAEAHPALHELLTDHRAEQARRMEWHRQKAEQDRIAKEILEARRRETIPDLEKLGLVAMFQAVIDDWPESFSFYPETWALDSIEKLESLPPFILSNLLNCYVSEAPKSDAWVKLGNALRRFIRTQRLKEKDIRNQARRARREVLMAQLEAQPTLERLRRVGAGRVAVTYYPEQWASDGATQVHSIPPDLCQQLLQKTERLKSSRPWKQLRKALLGRPYT